MSNTLRRLWLTVRRALLMIVAAIDKECGADPAANR
jgi:hypothetical protein